MRPLLACLCTTTSALLLAALPVVHAQPGTPRSPISEDAPGTSTADAPLQLYLEVVLNQTRLPQLMSFELRDDTLYAAPSTLRDLGFRDAGYPEDDAVPLQAIPGVDVRYDVARQRVEIEAPLSQLALDTTRLGAQQTDAPAATAAAPGALLNYDFYATDTSHGRSLTASSELRVFGLGRGVLSNTAVARTFDAPGHGWRTDPVRLDTNWELSFPEQAVTATFGDTFTGFLDWTRPVRIGGIQVGRNYALQPYRVTAPLPEFLGEVAVPSDIELYVNGVRQFSGSAPVGPFQLTAVPGITGAGNAQMVITDAFGRVRTLQFPFYSTQRLLARGLSDWSFSLGTVREDYGLRSFAYAGQPVASGNYRYGLSNQFTVEGHAEAGDGLVNAGAGGAWLMGTAGVLTASHTRSSHEGLHGAQTTLGYGWIGRTFNVSLDSRRTHGDYRDIASLYGMPPSPRSERAMFGMNTASLGSFSLNYVRLDHSRQEPDTSRYAGLHWSRSFAGAWSASLSVNQNLDDGSDRSLHLGLSIPLGRDHQLSTSWQRDRGRDSLVADLSRPVPGDGGYGWRLQGRAGDGGGGGGLAEIGWQGEYARLGAGISRLHGSRHSYAQASGSLVRMGGATFAAREIHDAFAVVSTDGYAGIPVKLENRVIGQTDHRGMLLVSRLNSWQRNKLSIDPMDLPANVRVGAVDQWAVPADRSGTHIQFDVSEVRAAVLVLNDEDGEPLPLGSRVRVAGVPGEAIVGFDGETYLETLGTESIVTTTTPEGAVCRVRFTYPTTADAVPRIGPLRCMEENGP